MSASNATASFTEVRMLAPGEITIVEMEEVEPAHVCDDDETPHDPWCPWCGEG